MKGSSSSVLFFVVASVLLALVPSLVSATDPSPLQDFCVAINHTKDHVYVNGKFCKDPDLVTAEDFYYSGLNTPGMPQPSGFSVTVVDVLSLLGLNTLGAAVVRVDHEPGGVVPPHYHPRATEMIVCMEGTLEVGFVTSYPEYRLYNITLHPGDVYVFPTALIHYQHNVGKTTAISYGFFNSQSPGIVSIPYGVFGTNPPINPYVLAKSFDLDENVIKYLHKQFGQKKH